MNREGSSTENLTKYPAIIIAVKQTATIPLIPDLNISDSFHNWILQPRPTCESGFDDGYQFQCIGSDPFGQLGLKTERYILHFQGLIGTSSGSLSVVTLGSSSALNYYHFRYIPGAVSTPRTKSAPKRTPKRTPKSTF